MKYPGMAVFAAGCLLSAVAVSCSSAEDSPVAPATDNAIRFAAKTEYSRGTDITTNNLTTFNVYAYTDTGSVYMDNVEVTKTGVNTWTYSPLRYWPTTGNLRFYAFSPASWVGADGPGKTVPVTNYYNDQDLVYAVSPALSSTSMGSAAQVVFNFRHALAKVNVKMSSSNSALTVKVSNVVLSNIASTGDFDFPDASTSDTPGADNVGTWSNQAGQGIIMLHVSQTDSELITLTDVPTDMATTGNQLGGDKYVIPQPLTYRSNGTGTKDTYIAVMCSVYDATTGAKVWPNENTPEENVVSGSKFGDGLLKFPLGTSAFSAWQPGYRYVYNLIINANDEMSPIQFGQPSVDSYVTVSANYE